MLYNTDRKLLILLYLLRDVAVVSGLILGRKAIEGVPITGDAVLLVLAITVVGVPIIRYLIESISDYLSRRKSSTIDS